MFFLFLGKLFLPELKQRREITTPLEKDPQHVELIAELAPSGDTQVVTTNTFFPFFGQTPLSNCHKQHLVWTL